MNHEQHEQPWWRTPIGIVTCGFLIVAGFFLLTEHSAHVFGALPWLLILACPLMHIFMHIMAATVRDRSPIRMRKGREGHDA